MRHWPSTLTSPALPQPNPITMPHHPAPRRGLLLPLRTLLPPQIYATYYSGRALPRRGPNPSTVCRAGLRTLIFLLEGNEDEDEKEDEDEEEEGEEESSETEVDEWHLEVSRRDLAVARGAVEWGGPVGCCGLLGVHWNVLSSGMAFVRQEAQ